MKDIDEAIQHCEDVAQQQDMLKGRYDDASGYTRSGNEAIRTSDAKKCEKCAADHRQLAEWLKDYKRLLELQSCEDAISRQAVLNLINADWKYEGLEEDVSSLPPVTPQPKTGHWIVQPSNKEQGERDFIWWKCSECGHVIYSETEKDRKEFHAFCGRCGAKMIEPQERSNKE